jgi:hypothetical protein
MKRMTDEQKMEPVVVPWYVANEAHQLLEFLTTLAEQHTWIKKEMKEVHIHAEAFLQRSRDYLRMRVAMHERKCLHGNGGLEAEGGDISGEG